MSRAGLIVVCLLATSAQAQARAKSRHPEVGSNPSGTAAEKAKQPSEDKPRFHPLDGPRMIDLGHDLQLDLPADMLFLEHAEAKELMERNGNVVGDNLIGLVGQRDKSWIVTVTYYEDGHVKDDEAADLDGDDILDSIREDNEEANKIRVERGFAPLAIDGWTEAPHYESAVHHLVWGIKVSDRQGASINFYTRVLGRKGYVALNLIDDPARIEASKTDALAVLKATGFRTGARYEDFDSKTDKVAEYGLAALVAGGAGAAALKFAKIGLLAKFGGKLLALLIAFKKALVLVLIAVWAALKRVLAMLRGKKEAAATKAAAATETALAPPNDGPTQP